jgi:hypothetical protein
MKISVRINLLFYLFSTVVPSNRKETQMLDVTTVEK